MKRARPNQHQRKYKTGKKTTVNKGIKKKPVRIKIKEPGALSKFGYDPDNSNESRQNALMKKISSFRRVGTLGGKKVTEREQRELTGRLQALAVFNKNKNPARSKRAQSDRSYVEKIINKIQAKEGK